MKRHGRCRLLELPREVRDYIYDELTQDACISTGVADKLGNVINIPLYIVLLGAPRTNVLLTNRQIHDEYDEHLANQGRLYVSYEHGASDTGTDWNFTARSLGLKPSVSCDALKHIRLCSIEFDWQMAIHSLDWPTASQSLSDDGPAMNEFFLLPIAQMRAQTALPWTPSKALCGRLKLLLALLEPLLSEDAKVQLEMNLTNYPDARDPYSTPGYEGARVQELTTRQIELHESASDRETMLSLTTDAAITWPKPGRLSVEFFMITPLFCTLATNIKDVRVNRRNVEARATEYLVLPDYTVSKMVVRWELSPQGSHNNWRGYWPKSASFRLR